jgi:hypothetical protein
LVYEQIRSEAVDGDVSSGDGDSRYPFSLVCPAVNCDAALAMGNDDVVP